MPNLNDKNDFDFDLPPLPSIKKLSSPDKSDENPVDSDAIAAAAASDFQQVPDEIVNDFTDTADNVFDDSFTPINDDTDNGGEYSEAADGSEFSELPEIPYKTVDDSLEAVGEVFTDNLPDADADMGKSGDYVESVGAEEGADFTDLPEIPYKTVNNSLDDVGEVFTDNLPDADAGMESSGDSVESVGLSESNDDDFELPPLPEVSAPKHDSTPAADDAPEEDPDDPLADSALDDTFDFDADYESGEIDPATIRLAEMDAKLTDLRTDRETTARNIKESVKFNDMMMEMGTKPSLSEMSTDYVTDINVKKVKTDASGDEVLDDKEKKALKQKLNEDLQSRPVRFNQRASRNMANRLLDAKNVKVAKKGFLAVLLCIVLGLASAAISYLFLSGTNSTDIWFIFVAIAMGLMSLALFIKAKMVKRLSMFVFFLCLAAYIVGFVMFIINPSTDFDADGVVLKLTMYIAAAFCNVISLVILGKSEAVEMYFTFKPSR
ncbi:MAG: vitamin K epoxide reductase family protein [Oscillospiraceae bacterium]|nr:vitamin K epoxide reductase family protein [Oscillospiraceae bacterium]